MHVAVDPGMLSPDPEVRRHSPSLLDANFYHGKYYLYYGVVPAVLFFTPYRLLTGQSLPPELAVLLAVLIGYFAAIRIWRAARSRYFPSLGASGELAAHLLLGLSTASPFLVARSSFYEVPIAAGYASVMGACLACYHALHVVSCRAIIALAGSSLAMGLAVGCRPNYLLATPALLAVALVLIYRRQGYQAHQSNAALLAAAVLPAAFMGAGLAFYNFARFGNPLEFGFNYGINSFFDSGATLMSRNFIWPNLQWTYFSPPGFSPYFPYVFPVSGSFRPIGYFGNEAYHGQYFSLLLLIWILFGISLTHRTKFNIRAVAYTSALAWIGLSSLLFMMLLTIRGNRYVVDFQASFILLGALVAGWTWSRLKTRNLISSIWRSILVILAFISATCNILGAIQQFDQFANLRPNTFKQLARFFDPLAYKLANALNDSPHGPVKFQAAFSLQKNSVVEPLVVAGLNEYTDGVYAIQYPDKRIELIMDHHGYGGPHSKPFPIEIGRIYNFEVDLGAFYPPRYHQFFDSYDAYTADHIKTIVAVRVDGKTILDQQIKAYDAPHASISIGKNDITNNPYSRSFSGKITGVQYPPNPHTIKKLKIPKHDGILELNLQFDLSTLGSNQPLIASGIAGAGNLLFAKIKSANEIQIGLDAWGYGGPLSNPIKFRVETAHIVQIFIGPLAASYPWEDKASNPDFLQMRRSEIQIWIDGEIAWKTKIEHHEDSYQSLNVGSNPQGFSSAYSVFSGKIDIVPISIEKKAMFLRQVLSTPTTALLSQPETR